MGMQTNTLRVATQPVDGQMRRMREIAHQIRALKKEKNALTVAMRTGVCEECGTEFHRLRVTKRYCSQACNMKASLRNHKAKRYDLALIAEALPLLEVSGQITDRNMDIVRASCALMPAAEIGGQYGLSPERVCQVLSRAHVMAKLLLRMRDMVRTVVSEELVAAR